MADADVPIRTDTQGPTTIIVAVFFGCLTFVVISLRMTARIFITKHLGPDDYLICIAALCTWAFMILNITAVGHGLGKHVEAAMAMGEREFGLLYRDVWVSSVFYNSSLGWIKCSVLALYSRLGDRQLRKMAFIVLGICASSATANVLVCIFQCWPLDAAWDQSITDKSCVNINAFYLANAATNIATDLLAYLLPMRLVKNLQIPRKQKIAVGVMLCLGLFTCVSSIIRISFIPVMLTSKDPTYVIAPPFYWSVIEINIGVLAASIPSFKPLAKRFLPRLIGESSYKQKGGYGNSGSLKGHYNGNSGSGFGRLDSQNAVHMDEFSKGGMHSHTESFNRPGRLQKPKASDISGTMTDDNERTLNGSSGSQHTNSSEEFIFKPGKADIVRTTEFTRTVEERPLPQRHHGDRDFFPGNAV